MLAAQAVANCREEGTVDDWICGNNWDLRDRWLQSNVCRKAAIHGQKEASSRGAVTRQSWSSEV